MQKNRSIKWIVIVLAALLSGCGGSALSGLITTHPIPATQQPREITRDDAPIDQSAYLFLQVEDLEKSHLAARQIAYDHSGYVLDEQTWFSEPYHNRILVMAVPSQFFNQTIIELKELGQLESQNISKTSVRNYYEAASGRLMANITLHLFSGVEAVEVDFFGWNPLATASKAFSVFVSIFGFLVDIAIWLVVVLGPFVLIGLGARAVWLRLQTNQSKVKK